MVENLVLKWEPPSQGRLRINNNFLEKGNSFGICIEKMWKALFFQYKWYFSGLLLWGICSVLCIVSVWMEGSDFNFRYKSLYDTIYNLHAWNVPSQQIVLILTSPGDHAEGMKRFCLGNDSFCCNSTKIFTINYPNPVSTWILTCLVFLVLGIVLSFSMPLVVWKMGSCCWCGIKHIYLFLLVPRTVLIYWITQKIFTEPLLMLKISYWPRQKQSPPSGISYNIGEEKYYSNNQMHEKYHKRENARWYV
jgi:hypothetical protein